MVKRICLLLALLLALASAAVLAQEGDLLDRIEQKGEIVIATEGEWRPWTYFDEQDVLVGFDVEVATAIAEKLGVTPHFETVPWDGIFAGLGTRYDMAANGVEVTEERAQAYYFSIPYAYLRTALVVRGDNEDINSFEDLAGKKTANSLASTYQLIAEEYGATVDSVDTLDETISLVLSGRVNATLNAEVSIYDYLSEHPEANIKIVALTEEASEVAIPVYKSDDSDPDGVSLVEAINAAIEELRAEGELARISEKYFGSDITGVEAQK